MCSKPRMHARLGAQQNSLVPDSSEATYEHIPTFSYSLSLLTRQRQGFRNDIPLLRGRDIPLLINILRIRVCQHSCCQGGRFNLSLL